MELLLSPGTPVRLNLGALGRVNDVLVRDLLQLLLEALVMAALGAPDVLPVLLPRSPSLRGHHESKEHGREVHDPPAPRDGHPSVPFPRDLLHVLLHDVESSGRVPV